MNEVIENQNIVRAAGTSALPSVQQAGQSDPGQLIQLAIQKDFDVERLRELMTLEREWREDKAKAEYAAAMVKFGSMKKTIQHNKTGKTAGGASFSYSDFPTIAKSVTPLMTDCGLSFSHRFDPPVMNEAGNVAYITVYCRVTHSSGHFEEIHFPAMPDMRLDGKVSPSQLIQLAITYAKRQTLCMALGLSTAEDATDDDGVTPATDDSIESGLSSAKSVDDLRKFFNALKPDQKNAYLDKYKIRMEELRGAK